MPPRKLLKDTLPLIPDPRRNKPSWIVDDFPQKLDGIRITFAGPREVRTTVQPVRAKASDVAKVRLKKFCDLLKLGKKPGEAARTMHSTIQEIMSHPDAQKEVAALVETYTLTAEVRKGAVRAAANKIMMDNLREEGDPKLALEAAKFIAQDTEVAITGSQAQQIQVDLTMRGIVTAPVEPLPGLPKELPPGKEQDVIDV